MKCFNSECRASVSNGDALFRVNVKGVAGIWACRQHRTSIDPVMDEVVTIIECGPNRACEHVFDKYVPITDSDGRVCGETAACSKCGETAFNLSMWE